MRVGWDRRYTNTNVYGKVHTGIDIAEQQVHSWPNLYDNSSGWGLWEVINGPTIDEDTAARAGLSASAELCEIDIVNNQAEAGWTWQSGQGNTVQGMSIDPWGQNGLYGGSILFTYGTVGSYDGNVGGLNSRWISYPAVFSAGNPPAVPAGSTIVVNGTTITLTAGETLAAIAAAINAAAIANVRAAATTWGGVVSRLVIYSTQASDLGTLTLSGTALPLLGIASGSYTTPRGEYAAAVGDAGSVAVGDKLVVNGTTVTVGGSGAASDVAAAINAAGIPGIAADTNANGVIVITCFMPLQPGGLVLADASGYTTLEKIALRPGTFLPPTPPKGFATAYSDLTTPICQPTDQITITATDIDGNVHGPVTVTLNGGAGTGWPQDVAASIQASLMAAGFYSGNFTALSSGNAVVAVRAVGGGLNQGVQIRNTAGGTLTLANAHGAPLDTLGIAAGTYQPGGSSAGSQTVFMAAEDSIATGGRGVFIGGVSNATDLTVYPHTPLETRGGFLHGLRLDRANFADGNAIVVAPTHAIAWGSAAQGQHLLTVAVRHVAVRRRAVRQQRRVRRRVRHRGRRSAGAHGVGLGGADAGRAGGDADGERAGHVAGVDAAGAGRRRRRGAGDQRHRGRCRHDHAERHPRRSGQRLWRHAVSGCVGVAGAGARCHRPGAAKRRARREPGLGDEPVERRRRRRTRRQSGAECGDAEPRRHARRRDAGGTHADRRGDERRHDQRADGTISGGTLQPAAIAGGALSGTITNLGTIGGGVIDLSAGALRVASSNTATGLIGNTGTLTTPQEVAIGTGLTLNAGTLETAPLTSVFTSSGTWTPRATSTFCRILMVGGGGGGGGGAQTASGTAASGGAGGGGGGVYVWQGPIAALPAGPYAVSVGAGGARARGGVRRNRRRRRGRRRHDIARQCRRGGRRRRRRGGQIGGASGGGGGGMGAVPRRFAVTGAPAGAHGGTGRHHDQRDRRLRERRQRGRRRHHRFPGERRLRWRRQRRDRRREWRRGRREHAERRWFRRRRDHGAGEQQRRVGGWVALYAASHGGGGTSATPNGGAAAMRSSNKPGSGGGGGYGNASGAGGAGARA